jgi:hypothetical protein
MLTAVLKAVKMLLSCCPKNSQYAAVLAALKAVQDAEKNRPHKDQVQRLIPITKMIHLSFKAQAPESSLLWSTLSQSSNLELNILTHPQLYPV